MLRLKTLLTIIIWIFIAQTLQAQQHYNAWLRGTLSIPISSKIKIETELQHRRQNGFDNGNMFDQNLTIANRNWIHYQHKRNVKFSVSPFAYFSNYKIIQKQADEMAEPNHEIRFSIAAELQHEILKKFYAVNRTSVEYRIFNTTQADITRLRNRLGLRYDFTDKIKLSVYDEPFLNLTGTNSAHIFDHNRIGLNLEYRFIPNLKFDIGYIRVTRLPLTNTTKLYENNTFMSLTYQLRKLEGKKRSQQIRKKGDN